MQGQHVLGAVFVFALITVIGIYSGRRVKSAYDFSSGGRKAGAGVVVGSIIGTLVGGASTIGTAQLAFSYGLSAWWFTLGGALACLILGLFYAKPLYNSGVSTMPQILTREYGQSVGTSIALLTSLGSFLSIVSQMLSGIALISTISPVSPIPAAIAIIVLMLLYVLFGGVWGAGLVGIAKTVLLSAAVGFCGLLALSLSGGFSGLYNALPHSRYFNLFARGAIVDIGAGLSLVLGVLTTQAYIQAVISTRTLRLSRLGAVSCAAIIPFIGIAGICVGLYMQVARPDIDPSMALPMFVLEFLPPIAAGSVLAILLVALVGTGAGVALGMSSMLCNDIYKVYVNKNPSDRKTLLVNRMIIIGILILAALLSSGNVGSLILDWSFLSMGLRGATAFGPLSMALFFPKRLPARYAAASIVIAPALVIIGRFTLPGSIDPLFIGVIGSLAVIAAGAVLTRRNSL